MQIRFDKYKPAGKVTPPLNGAVWFQVAEDGIGYHFNGAGDPVDIDTGEVLVIKAKPAKAEKVQSEVVTVDVNGDKKIEVVEEDAKPVIDPKIELIKWLRGNEGAETNWMKVRGYGKDVLGKVASGADDLIGKAIDAGIIKESEVKAG
jgi:hypothetical protein